MIFGTGNCVDPDAVGPLQRRDGRGRPRRRRGALDVPAARVEPRRPRLRRRAEPDRRRRPARSPGSATRTARTTSSTATTGAPVDAIAGDRPGPDPAGRQLLDRRVHRPGGVPRRDRRRRHRGRAAAVPARHRRRDRRRSWQNQEPSATYAATAIADNVAIVGGTDFTLRAVAVDTGDELWSHPMKGAVSGGAAITKEDVFAVAGIREPGLDKRSRVERRLPLLAARQEGEDPHPAADAVVDDAAATSARRRSASARRASSASS